MKLPICMGDSQPVLEAWGIVLGEPVDDLFLEAALPVGWTIVSYGDNGYGLRVLDEAKRPRIEIFYKGAYWDRRASMCALRRYRPTAYWSDLDPNWAQGYVLRDDKEAVWQSDRVRITKENEYHANGNSYRHIRDVMCEQAITWLNENKPDWKDPSAYWDEI